MATMIAVDLEGTIAAEDRHHGDMMIGDFHLVVKHGRHLGGVMSVTGLEVLRRHQPMVTIFLPGLLMICLRDRVDRPLPLAEMEVEVVTEEIKLTLTSPPTPRLNPMIDHRGMISLVAGGGAENTSTATRRRLETGEPTTIPMHHRPEQVARESSIEIVTTGAKTGGLEAGVQSAIGAGVGMLTIDGEMKMLGVRGYRIGREICIGGELSSSTVTKHSFEARLC